MARGTDWLVSRLCGLFLFVDFLSLSLLLSLPLRLPLSSSSSSTVVGPTVTSVLPTESVLGAPTLGMFKTA